MDRTWYETFFRGVALDVWRKAIPAEATRLEVDFLIRALRLSAGARVLDVPCGLGRHAIELAARGYAVTGVDLSAEGIGEARTQAAALGLDVEWRHGDMRDLPWPARFDAAFCFGNSFGYLEPQGTRAFVEAVAHALKPHGFFAMHTGAAAESVLPRLVAREESLIDDILFIEENRYIPWESCVATDYTFVRDGTRETRSGLQWVFTLRELRELLAQVGLVCADALASVEGEPFRTGSPVLILIAQKTQSPS